jgi:hypothetical protein
MATSKLITYAKQLADLLNEKDRLKQALKDHQEKLDKFQVKFVALMTAEKVNNFNVDGIGTCYVNDGIFVKTVDQEALFKFLRKNKAGGLIKETVNGKTLAAYVKELSDTKNIYPDGVEVTPNPTVRIRGRNKEE